MSDREKLIEQIRNAQMLTDDRRCGQCGEPVTSWEGEPRMVDNGRGWLEADSVTYVLQPCGHAFTQAVGRG
jgi:hypothetical protein